MPQPIHVSELLQLQKEGINVVDVRTHSEFLQGHIPKAINIELFSNVERARVGKLYKKVGREEAIKLGLELVGPKLKQLVETIVQHTINNRVVLHCWRGGMRSGSVAWLIELMGIKVYVLKGGYKAFRSHVLSTFQIPLKLVVVGGKTGSAKTKVLKAIQEQGKQILDLEELANHRGSAFGAKEGSNLTQEQFENDLFEAIKQLDATQQIFIEDESRVIGKKVIPETIWHSMRSAPLINLNVSNQARVNYLVEDYGKLPKEILEANLHKIAKRLGGLSYHQSLDALNKGDLVTVCKICLVYYDKAYLHGLSMREKESILTLDFDSIDIKNVTKMVIDYAIQL
ncbi:MAG: tRNA 2-selenouridine(34) synthase MnmH [Bacteroidetes bacterium]|nr:tRNA 2-selenouridine(34) synthase MnmH [Bacteroidota bacterium]MCA6444569.1 tRNA 2-selenouridine(34) synthase MnmH [Bacteroidota bacterium]